MKNSNILVLLAAIVFAGCSSKQRGSCQKNKPSNLTISEKAYGGDDTDNPDINTESKKILNNAKTTAVFKSKGVELNSKFSGGRMTSAKVSKDGAIEVFIDSENFPINDSPWYAFEVKPLESMKKKAPLSVKIRLTYPANKKNGNKGTHRYIPKLSTNGGVSWSQIEDTKYNHKKAELEVNVPVNGLMISAQELDTSSHSKDWTENLAKKSFVELEIIGKSAGGRPIRMLNIVEGPAKDQDVVIMSRQHPPEVTGTLAMRKFVEYLVGDSIDAKKFRQSFNIRVIPMINPDGVDEGHWRHNLGGVDLNRDWSETTLRGRKPLFNQPETKAVSEKLKTIKRKIVFAIDFHSTQKDVIYILNDDQRNLKNDLAMKWIYQFARSVPDRQINVHRIADIRYYSTSLAWLHRKFGTQGIVYEVGDNTPRDELAKVAEKAAASMINLLSM